MKNFASVFLIVISAVLASWLCLVVVGASTLNPYELEPNLTVAGEDVQILGTQGLAGRGQAVYAELGCAQCHTQQVRRPGYGGDLDREWGSRQSVARDYILDTQVVLGTRRIGPDLSNVGARRDAEWLFAHLNNPQSKSEVSTMPSYHFLFKEKESSGLPATNALTIEGNDAPEEGFEVVPTADAVALVAYLQSLNLDYDLPESKRVK